LLLADDATGKNPDELDYFECRFNQAFAAFRIDLVRSELKEQSRFTSLPDDSPDPDDEVRSKIDQEPAERAEQGDGLARDELLSKLPPEVRKAVVLCHEMGYEVESKDPTKVTAATICGVTGRTIRNRLQEAAEYLSRYNQEDI